MRNEPRTEVLRVGYSPSATAGFLPEALQKFHAAHPGVRIELADLFPHEAISRAREGELDIVITLESPGAAVPHFRWEELCKIPLVLVLPAKHPLAKLKRVPPTRLAESPRWP